MIKEALLKAGHHITIEQPSDSLWITSGNAPALRIDVDGRTLIPAGKLGNGRRVIRNYRVKIK